jgi:hypothetical protein
MAKFLLKYTRTTLEFIEVEVEADSTEEVYILYNQGKTDNRVVDADIIGESNHEVTYLPA